MLFNSFRYVFLFLPVAALVYGLASSYIGVRSAQAWLLLCSLFFYGSGKPSNLLLLACSMLFNWAIGRLLASLADGRMRRSVFWFGLGADIAFLFSFKYVNMFLLGVAALHGPKYELPDLEFPLGVSFFTLTQIMYLVDTYQSPETVNSLLDHITFVSFFPQVVSGPISRSSEVVPQFNGKSPSVDRMGMACRGLYLFSIGLAKKVVLADSFGHIADAGFKLSTNYSTLEAWIFCLAYAFQIYFDFSGYSDMAVASALMLGIEIPQNFNAPFRALSISEYWTRWHISLSNFITSYIYTPILRGMGGRPTVNKSAIATTLAMTIAGIWHGPSLTFALWGTANGLGLAVNQIWKRRRKRLPNWVCWTLTFGFVNLMFVLFRSPTLAVAGHMYACMLPQTNLLGTEAFRGVLPLTPVTLLRPVAIGVVLALFFKTSHQLADSMQTLPSRALAAAALVLLSCFFMNSTGAKTFIYFAF